MAGVFVEIDLAEVATALRGMEARLINTEPLMAEIGEILISQSMDSFENQEAPDGTPWEPSQRALAEGGQTLIDSGQLRASISSEALPDEVTVASSKVYAAIHQFGGEAGRGHAVTLPARPFVPDIDSVDMAEIHDAINRHFAGVGL